MVSVLQAAIKTRDEEEGSNARSPPSTVVPQEDADEAVGTAVADDTSPAVATAPVSIPQVVITARLVFRVSVSGRLLMFVFGCTSGALVVDTQPLSLERVFVACAEG